MTQTEEEALAPIEDNNIIRSGRLNVGDGHELYWVDWGNRDVKNPIFYLHGGPGGGFNEKHFRQFNPLKHRVVFHDQRGSGRSTPFASTSHNTSQDLVEDITKLKDELGFNKISLYGFSWGSTLSLLYAIANPGVVEKMLIGGIYLARKVDADFYMSGGVGSHFPEAWARFNGNVPEAERANVAGYYKKMMDSKDAAERERFAAEWLHYESSLFKLDYVPNESEKELMDFTSLALSYLEAHYILNDCFIEENYILNNAYKLHNIQIVIVHGRYDLICMPSGAYDLRQALGDKAILHFVTSGHARSDMVQREVVKAYLNLLWQ